MQKNKYFKFIKKNYFIILLLLIAFFLRFYKLSELFFFNIDEEWFNFIVRKIVVLHKPVLIGWEIPGGILVPPVMYYFGSLVMFLFRNNPLGFAVTASAFGVFGVFLIYFVAKQIFNNKFIAFSSAIIYCFSYLINIYNRLSINLLFSPILSLLTYLFLFKLAKTRNKNWLIPLAVVFIFATQEGSMLSLFLLFIFYVIIIKPKIRVKDYFKPVLIFLSCFLPVIVFELRHNFIGISKIINFLNFTNEKQAINLLSLIKYFNLLFRTITRILIPTGPADINMQILPCKDYLEIIEKSTPAIYSLIGMTFIIIFLITSLREKNNLGKKLIILHFMSVLIGLFVYSLLKPGYLYEWFFIILIPAFCYVISYLLQSVVNFKIGKLVTIVFFVIFIFVNLKANINNKAIVGYKDKLNAVKYIISNANNNNINLEILGNSCNGYGYRYLFTYLNFEPAASYTDLTYVGWLHPKNEKIADTKVIIIPLSDLDSDDLKDKYLEYKTKSKLFNKIGNLEILFLDNTK